MVREIMRNCTAPSCALFPLSESFLKGLLTCRRTVHCASCHVHPFSGIDVLQPIGFTHFQMVAYSPPKNCVAHLKVNLTTFCLCIE